MKPTRVECFICDGCDKAMPLTDLDGCFTGTVGYYLQTEKPDKAIEWFAHCQSCIPKAIKSVLDTYFAFEVKK